MPLYEFDCMTCGRTTEEIYKYDERPKTVPCSCGSSASLAVSLPAHTPGRWGDNTGKYGVNGKYEPNLGARYHNTMEFDRLCEQKGVIPLSQVDPTGVHMERYNAKKAEQLKAQDKLLDDWKDSLEKHGGDKVAAAEETFSAQKCLSGELDVVANPVTHDL